MKAQISFVEFLTSMVIFITFVGYFSLQVLIFIPSYIDNIKGERLRSEAFQVSELLINDPGQPLDWDVNFANATRIGLLDQTENKTNLLSGSKISTFNSTCQLSYSSVKNLMGIDNDFSLILISGSETKISCNPPVITTRQIQVTIRRVIAFNEGGTIKYGELILQMW